MEGGHLIHDINTLNTRGCQCETKGKEGEGTIVPRLK